MNDILEDLEKINARPLLGDSLVRAKELIARGYSLEECSNHIFGEILTSSYLFMGEPIKLEKAYPGKFTFHYSIRRSYTPDTALAPTFWNGKQYTSEQTTMPWPEGADPEQILKDSLSIDHEFLLYWIVRDVDGHLIGMWPWVLVSG